VFVLVVCVFARKSLLNVVIVLALNVYTLLTGGWITLLFQHIRFRDIELLLVGFFLPAHRCPFISDFIHCIKLQILKTSKFGRSCRHDKPPPLSVLGDRQMSEHSNRQAEDVAIA